MWFPDLSSVIEFLRSNQDSLLHKAEILIEWDNFQECYTLVITPPSIFEQV